MPGFFWSDIRAGLSEVNLMFYLVLTGLPHWCSAGGWSVLEGAAAGPSCFHSHAWNLDGDDCKVGLGGPPCSACGFRAFPHGLSNGVFGLGAGPLWAPSTGGTTYQINCTGRVLGRRGKYWIC